MSRRSWFRPPEVEAYGVDRIAESERTATPWSFVFIAMGNNMSLGAAVWLVPAPSSAG